MYLMMNVNKCNPMRVGCFVQIPRDITLTKALLNVCSPDNACFAWAIIAALYPARTHPERSCQYPHYSTLLNLNRIEFPMTLKQITRFERFNNISVNVFTTQERKNVNERSRIVPLRLTDDKRARHVNLLYLTDSRLDGDARHFVDKELVSIGGVATEQMQNGKVHDELFLRARKLLHLEV
ncbi:hypothetical protein DMN91_002115 [Ooceraea biroi]|uniref:Uncharacterized protein n=1 Tax=Ooceraea biroi TaxID=2015173 RepID=A0A3L8E076_OOCBI|nr:hypothetical protein DMN91_002115 [Ooceraea biroi]